MNADKSIPSLLLTLRTAVSNAILPLQTGRGVADGTLDALIVATEGVVGSLKGQQLVGKDVLKEIYFAERILRAESERLSSGPQRDVLLAADRLQHLFGLVMLDESPDDRRPGVPRVT